jgi:hypothetical protein
VSSGGSGGAGGGEDPGLAAPCEIDAHCGPDAFCLTADAPSEIFPAGGPAGGYCTRACTGDLDCPGEGSTCHRSGVCLLGCTFGPPLASWVEPLHDDKCRGREDLVCAYFDGIESICRPICGSDEQCPAGLSCDRRSGLCTESPFSGEPNGSACSTPGEPDVCEGFCINTGDSLVCASACVAGGAAVSHDCGGLENGFCGFVPSNAGAGDLGMCTRACTTHGDCNAPSYLCVGLREFVGQFVSNGFCFSALTCAEAGVSLGEPCYVNANYIGDCTQTQWGDLCVDPAFGSP